MPILRPAWIRTSLSTGSSRAGRWVWRSSRLLRTWLLVICARYGPSSRADLIILEDIALAETWLMKWRGNSGRRAKRLDYWRCLIAPRRMPAMNKWLGGGPVSAIALPTTCITGSRILPGCRLKTAEVLWRARRERWGGRQRDG